MMARLRLSALSPTLKRWLAIVIGAFVLYNANGRELGLSDTLPATLLPASLVLEGNLALDEFRDLLATTSVDGMNSLTQQLEWTYAVREIDGELRSSYPVGAALLATPVYALPAAFGWLKSYDDYRLLAKISASLMVALSAGFLFLALTRVASLDVSVLLSAVYALGTSAWTIASQALWQHGPAMLCLAAALWLALRVGERGSTFEAALLSTALGLALICRLQDFVAVAAIGVYALVRRPRRWAALLLPGAALAAWLFFYNERIFHDLRGGYPALYQSPAHAWRGLEAGNVFTLPLHEGLAGVLLSPGKGLFVYAPVMALPLALLPVLALRERRSLAPYLLVWVFGTLFMLAKNQLWWGGTCYGPRYMSESMIALTFALGMAWPGLPSSVRVVLVVLAVFGVFVQVVGVLTWECGWHISPKWLDFAPERLWDWHDPEIARCSKALFSSGPRSPDIGPFGH